MRLPIALLSCAAVLATLTFPAVAATLVAGAGPNSGSATQACVPPAGNVNGSRTVTFGTTCSRADVGTASGDAVAATGHVGASAHADSHNGNSLVAEIAAQGIYDDFLVFTSSNPANTVASVSANLILTGILEAGGPVALAGVESTVTLFGALFDLRFTLDQAGNLSSSNSAFVVDGGAAGAVTNLQFHTPFVSVFLNSPVHFTLDLQTGAVASGPGSHALANFINTSLKFPTGINAFNLPDGVTVNAGDYLVNNRFIDPLAAVPEPAAWALMLAGFGVIGTSLRRRRARSLR